MASRSFLKNRLAEIEKAVNVGTNVHIKVDGFSCEIYEKDRTIFYNPSETAIKFHESKNLVKGLMGPIGSGKTTINIWDMIIEAVKMPRCKDGVRRYRGIIIRNTYSELQTTTLKSWMEWFGGLGNAKLKESSPIRYRSVFNDSEGEIDIEVYFLSMDREDNVKKLDSLETTRVFINEARHVPIIVIGRSQGRLRFPKREEIGSYQGHVAFDTNPPKIKSDLFDLFEKERPEGYELIKQPPGLIKVNNKYVTNPRADNLMHLSEDYYINSAKGQTEEHIRVMLLGEYGITEGKKRIYHEYNHDFHSTDSIEYIKGRPIYMGIDYETLPSVIIAQTTQNGRILIIKELMAEKSGVKSFSENILLPYINTTLSGYELIVTDDPSGIASKPTDEKNCRMILSEFGIIANPAYSNLIKTRIETVKGALNDMVDGVPKICVSREGCPTLIEGFMEGYHYRTVMTADGLQSTGKPEKNNFADIHDGLQYVIMGILGAPQSKTSIKPKFRPRGVFI